MDGMGQLIGTTNAHTESQCAPADSRTAGPTAPMGSGIEPSWWRSTGRPVAEVVFLLTRQGNSTDDTAVIATMPRPAPVVVRSTLLRLIEHGVLTGEPVRSVEGGPALRVVDVGVTPRGVAALRGTHPPEGPAGPASC